MRREQCSACGCGDLRQVLDLGESPIADAYLDRPDDPAPRYPLQVAVCGKCHLVQLLEVLPHELLFGTGYSFYTSASPPLSRYHERYAGNVLGRHFEEAHRLTVEIGCNDGDLLRHFAAADCPVLGVDPAAGPAGAARERGLPVLVEPFTAELAHRIVEGRGRAGLVVANHVLAHVADVADMLAGIAALLDRDGVAMVEVQYLPDLIVNNAFDLVYHEHRNFFSLGSLQRAAARWGLGVVHAETTDRQGGSLRVMLAHGGLPSARATSILESERWLDDLGTYDGLQGRASRLRTRLWDLVVDEWLNDRPVAGYGAPAKATTLLNFCGLDRKVLTHVVDTTPAKQGRFIPGTEVQILAPEDAPPAGTYLLLAWNYLHTIVRDHAAHARDGGPRWIVPVPAPMML